MRLIKQVMIILVTTVSLVGCAGLEVKRTVENNLFVSESEPSMKIKVDPSLTYFGKYEKETSYHQVTGSPSAVNTVFAFGDIADGNRVRRALIISFWKIKFTGNYWLPEVFANAKYVLDKRTAVINGTTFSNVLGVSSPFFGREEQAFIQTKGYVAANSYMWRGLGGIVDNLQVTKMYVFYIEDMKEVDRSGRFSLDKWQSEAMLVPEQRTLLSDFADRSNRAFTILGTVSDTGYKAVEETPSTKDKDNDIVERLKKLKELRDNGLITQDEYDKKRAEILKDM